MKIVINAFSARVGGGQTYLKHLLSRLPTTPSVQIILLAPRALHIEPDPRIERLYPRWPVTNPLLRTVWERFVLPTTLRRTGAEILFCPGGFIPLRVPKGCRTAVTFQNMLPFSRDLVMQMPWGLQRLRNIILKRLMLRSMATADLTIFISEFAKSTILQIGSVKNSVTIPHGISEDFRTADLCMKRPRTLPAEDYLLYVSRFDIYKHHREVVLGYAALPNELREIYPLVLIGETNFREASNVSALVDKLGLSKQVKILGAVDYSELPAWYKHAKLSLFASSCENCPNILLEALASGRPVLSSNVDPMPEFGGDGILYFSPTDPATITQAIQLILDDKITEDRVAAAASQRGKKYDWAMTAQRTWSSFGELYSTSNFV